MPLVVTWAKWETEIPANGFVKDGWGHSCPGSSRILHFAYSPCCVSVTVHVVMGCDDILFPTGYTSPLKEVIANVAAQNLVSIIKSKALHDTVESG